MRREAHNDQGSSVSTLSFNQQGRLLSEGRPRLRLAPFSTSLCLATKGDIDRAALAECLNEMLKRHDILRTAFKRTRVKPRDAARNDWPGGLSLSFRPWTSADSRVDLAVITPERRNGEDADAAAIRHASAEAERPFDLGCPPLIRASVINVSAKRELILIVANHLVTDGLSIAVLRDELITLYRGLTTERQIEPLPSPIQHIQFVLREHDRSASASWSASVAHWRQRWCQFATAQFNVNDLPFGRSRSDAPRVSTVATQSLSISPETVHRIRLLASSQGVTVHTLLLALFAGVLHVGTGRSRIALWSAFANRASSEMQRVIGWLANTHLQGLICSPEMSFDQLVTQARSVMYGDLAHEEIPLTFLWKLFGNSERSIPRVVVSDIWVGFGSHRIQKDPLEQFEEIHVPPTMSLPRLDAVVLFNGERLSLLLYYSPEWLDGAGISAIGDSLRRGVDCVIARPNVRLKEMAARL